MPILLLLLALSACAHKKPRNVASAPISSTPALLPRAPVLVEPMAPNCLSDSDRNYLLALADPENFPKSKYRIGPRYGSKIEKETDCSHFVHEIYKRAGFPYEYRSSYQLRSAPEFEKIPESEAKAGDLVLFPHHVGILDEEGAVISATYRRHRQSAVAKMAKEKFHRKGQILRSRCPAIVQR